MKEQRRNKAQRSSALQKVRRSRSFCRDHLNKGGRETISRTAYLLPAARAEKLLLIHPVKVIN